MIRTIARNLTRLFVLGLSLSSAFSSRVAGAEDYHHNWPQWRGPTGNGIALQGNPPLEWSETKNIKWKVPIPGEGHATPVIWGNRLFILTAVPSGGAGGADNAAADRAAAARPPANAPGAGAAPRRGPGGPGGRGGFGGAPPPTQEYAFTILCLDRASGRVLWEQVSRKEVPHEGRQSSNSHASGSPVTDGERVYAFFGSHGLYAYDLAGNPIWDRDLGDMRTRNGFGEGSSPALFRDVLVVLWDTEDESFVYAFDKRTGKELWRTARDEATGWTTPYPLEHNGRAQVVINGTNAVRCYDLNTGDLIWECSGQTANAIPSLVADTETVYALSGFRGSTAQAIALGGTGDLRSTGALRWELNRGTPYVPSPLLMDGHLFFCQGNDAIVTSVNAATGETWYTQERLPELAGVYASPAGVGKRIYLPGRNGATAVLESGKELKILALNKLDDPIDASPAIVGDELFLRGHHHLYCIATP